MESKNRKDIDNKYKWDLSLMIKDDKELKQKKQIILSNVKKLQSLKKSIFKSSDYLYQFLKLEEQIETDLGIIYLYSNLLCDSDSTVTKSQALKLEIKNFYNEITTKLSFISPLFMKHEFEEIKKLIEGDDRLKTYRHYFEDFYREKEHILDEEKELLISKLSKTMSVGRNVYYNLTNTDSYLGYVKDVDGKDILLTETNYVHLLHSKNPKIRKNVFEKYYDFYSKHKNAISTMYASQVKQDEVISEIRKYPSSLEASLYADNITIDVYNSLINNIHNNLHIMDEFMGIKAKLLNQDKLHMYDVYINPLMSNTKYSYEDAKKIVFDALGILGNDYLQKLERPFKEKWIDVYPAKGKKSGAYQWSTYQKPTYVLLNHNDDLESVYTMAHELGHAMHSLHSYEKQDFINSDYPIFLAEIASTTNEVLLTEYFLRKSKDKNEKLNILVKFLDEVRTTIFRQTMFAEFEKIIHDYERKGISLTEDKISKTYYKLNKLYYGNNVISDKQIRYEWERIPHFYTSFYVYKYATGMISAICIAANILKNKKYAKEYEEKFLAAGGSNYPLEILNSIGIDITTRKPYEVAFAYIEEKLKELKNLMK